MGVSLSEDDGYCLSASLNEAAIEEQDAEAPQVRARTNDFPPEFNKRVKRNDESNPSMSFGNILRSLPAQPDRLKTHCNFSITLGKFDPDSKTTKVKVSWEMEINIENMYFQDVVVKKQF